MQTQHAVFARYVRFYARISLAACKTRTLSAWPHPVIRRIARPESGVSVRQSHAANHFRPQSWWRIRLGHDLWLITA